MQAFAWGMCIVRCRPMFLERFVCFLHFIAFYVHYVCILHCICMHFACILYFCRDDVYKHLFGSWRTVRRRLMFFLSYVSRIAHCLCIVIVFVLYVFYSGTARHKAKRHVFIALLLPRRSIVSAWVSSCLRSANIRRTLFYIYIYIYICF